MHAYQKAGRLPALAPLQRHPACVRGYAPRMLLPLLSGGPSSLSCTRKYVSLLKNRKSERSTAHTHTRERVRRARHSPQTRRRETAVCSVLGGSRSEALCKTSRSLHPTP